MDDEQANEQLAIVERIVNDSANYCVVGAAGTGKTWLLKLLYEKFSQLGRRVVVCATTGSVVSNLQDLLGTAQTLHKWSHCQICDPAYRDRYMCHIRDDRELVKDEILFVDEMGMMSGASFDFIGETVGQALSSSSSSSSPSAAPPPFGGKRIILFGDPYQLPPVDGVPIFGGRVWRRLGPPRIVELRSNWRFVNDGWKEMLLRARVGRLSMLDVETYIIPRLCRGDTIERMERKIHSSHRRRPRNNNLNNLNNNSQTNNNDHDDHDVRDVNDNSLPSSRSTRSTILHIFTKKEEASRFTRYISNRYLADKCERHYAASLEIADKRFNVKMTQTRVTELPSLSLRFAYGEYDTTLRAGSQVMIVYNVSAQLFNGTMGYVRGLHANAVSVELKNGAIVRVEYQELIIKRRDEVHTLRFLPVRMAYGVTVHKIQGSTVDKCVVHLDNLFAEAHAYTMLSRVPNPENLFILTRFTSKRELLAFLNNYNRQGDEFARLAKEQS